MPEASVIRRVQALSGFTGRKASAGGMVSGGLKTLAQLEESSPNWQTRASSGILEFSVEG